MSEAGCIPMGEQLQAPPEQLNLQIAEKIQSDPFMMELFERLQLRPLNPVETEIVKKKYFRK